MQAMYAPAMQGDTRQAGNLAALAAKQPEAVLTILDARLAPGTNDQWQMAAAVASHFEGTPHTVLTEGASPLGKVMWLKFRVVFGLPSETNLQLATPPKWENCADKPASRNAQPQRR